MAGIESAVAIESVVVEAVERKWRAVGWVPLSVASASRSKEDLDSLLQRLAGLLGLRGPRLEQLRVHDEMLMRE